MKYFGDETDGLQHKQKGKLQLRTQSKTVAEVDSSGISGHVSSTESGIFRNPATINSAVEITSDENAVMAGPVTIGTNGQLVVNGTLVIV